MAPSEQPLPRVASLQPSISVIFDELGLLDCLVACTKYCVDVVPSLGDGSRMILQDSWTANAEEIRAANPDLVIASVPYRMESLAEILKAGIPLLALAPKNLNDVFQDIRLLSRTLGASDRGESLISRMQAEIAAVREGVHGGSSVRVYCEEWGKPVILSQHWVSELVEAAGGTFWGEPGKHIEAEDVLRDSPDVICMAWCGAGDRVPLEKVILKRGWQNLEAVRRGRVFCINDEFLNTPAPTLLHGLRALASAAHPEVFGAATAGLRQIDLAALQRISESRDMAETSTLTDL